jgi:hypothetical protein
VGSAPVVPAQIAAERSGPSRARVVAAGVGPLAEQRLDEALGLAIRTWPVEAGVAPLDPKPRGRLQPGARVIGLGVVGQQALDQDALLPIPGEGALEEADAGLGILARQQLGIGQPRVVVDRDVQVLPADPPVALGTRPARSPSTRLPGSQKRPSLFVSMCKSSPACSRSQRRAQRAAPAGRGSREQPWRRRTLPIVEGGCGSSPANRTGPEAERWRAATISRSASGQRRRGCRRGVEGRSRSAAQPPAR